MLIPQFSIRTLLIVTTVCAVFFSVVGLAVRGNSWAMGVSAGVLSLVVLAICGTFLFSLVWVASAFWDRVRGARVSDDGQPAQDAIAEREPNDSPFARPTSLEDSPSTKPPGATGSTLCLIFLLVASVTTLQAQTQEIEPWQICGGTRFATGAGLTMKVDSRWPIRGGYRPVRVTFSRPAAVKADRTLTVELRVLSYYRGSKHLVVSEDFEIPAAATQVSKVISVPQLFQEYNVVIDVFENELKVKPLSAVADNSGMNQPWQYGLEPFETMAILFVGDKLPDTSQLCMPFGPQDTGMGMGMYGPQGMGGPVMGGGMGMGLPQPSAPKQPSSKPPKIPLPSAIVFPATELPTRWIDYTGLDVVCLSLAQLRDLQKKRPKAFDAITAWTTSGGNLWVFGVGSDWKHLGELERLLGISKSENKTQPTEHWTKPDVKRFGLDTKDNVDSILRYRELIANPDAAGMGGPGMGGGMGMGYTPIWDLVDQAVVKSPDAPKPPKNPHFVYRDHDMGMVVAFDTENPFPGTHWQWQWLLDATGPNRWNWMRRHELEVGNGNLYFLNFCIPGVGLAPVSAFRILLTLFVLAIGPLNYFLLRRFRRLNLLVITIPAGAILVTAALFTYALVSDGLSTRVRVRSATIIDQNRGRAVCWSRMCYYAGMAPSQGLKFPADVAVMPIEPPEYYKTRISRELIWDDEQWMSQGWLDARTLTQYLTIRSRPTTAGLEITPSPRGNNVIEVKNKLGTDIERMVVRMPDGKYYWAGDVDQDAKTTATAVEAAEVMKWQGKRRSQEQLEFPESMRGFRSYYSGLSDSSRLERKLAGLGNAGGECLKAGTYVAVVRRSPEVVLGLDGALEEGSFHVVLGSFGEETQP